MKSIASTLVLFLVLITGKSTAQDFDPEKRYSFAKSYYGLDFSYVFNLSESAFLDGSNQLQSLTRNNFITPSLNIGATHFWGYADFFVSISTPPRKSEEDEIDNSIRFGALTGMRLFPSPIEPGKVRPYVSYKFAPIRLIQNAIGNGNYKRTQVKSIFGAGIAYQTPKVYAYLGYEVIPDNETSIYISRDQTTSSSFPKGILNFSINYSLETTRGSYNYPIPVLDSLLNEKNMLGWFFAVGPSSAFPTQNSSYINDLYPFLDDRAMPGIFPEFTLGYHFSKQDFIISANYRSIRQERNAFSFTQKLNRKSLGVEAYKFLFDYNGFAPFVGAGILHESITFREDEFGAGITNETHNITTPSIVFGWDIRPARKADIWLLRTNLRYSPTLELEKRDRLISLQYLEFNFIQVVIYPQRIKKYRELNR